ncbi:hypothetical protein SUGI_0444310 [Cryptomeria japonica]|uniref:protein trichome birefringence-like 6 n=1 Tax=Cryptomeria japonica TaxID=3369 RepID=UPI002408C57C|nr:protein trichome birefringence-like 6 [Cryptomeria japonica]GLJ23467.1 hypothetical protein SUGI_0444310 [Cryptomeria japonica]
MGYKGRARESTYLSIRVVGWTASLFMICGLFIIWKGDRSWLQNAPILQFYNTNEKNLNVSLEVEESHHGKNVTVSMAVEEGLEGKNKNVPMAEEDHLGKNKNVPMAAEGDRHGKNKTVSMAKEEVHRGKNVTVSMAVEEGLEGKNKNVSMVAEEDHHGNNKNVSIAVEEDCHGKNKNGSIIEEKGHHGKNVTVSIAVEEGPEGKNKNIFMAVEEDHQGKSKNVFTVVEEGHEGENLNVSMVVEEDQQGKINDSTQPNRDGHCNLSAGKWVYDESYVLYVDGPCPFANPDVNCRKNGRVDSSYERWRWQPNDCDLPRFDILLMLEKLRGKRLVYVGDSINRNQWQSMLCLLRVDGSNVESKDDGYFLRYFVKGYNCSIEFSWAPFLVQQNWNNGRETLRIDMISQQSKRWRDADILVFNSWHWWTHPEPRKGINYFEEGGQVVPYMEEHAAFEKALGTWTKWIRTNINPSKTQVYFRGYSPLHFHGKGWGKEVSGGCFNETEPIDKLEKEAKRVHGERRKMEIVEKVVEESKNSVEVKLLNITEMSMYRKDAHPSVYTSKYSKKTDKNDYGHADCSHWCLPGLPDVWNNILYAFLV